MAKTILTQQQQLLLDLFSKQKAITQNFYLSGGTALSEFYLHHRLSEDLDFFTQNEIDPLMIQTTLEKIKREAGIVLIDFQQSFNRNLFFLHTKKEIIKTEFTYYPFTLIEQPQIVRGIAVDSIIDIAVNKTFTIYQQPSSRHFIDLYMILTREKLKFEDMLKKARNKFDSVIDPIQMGSQLLKVSDMLDYPTMLRQISEKEWKGFWREQAMSLKKEALT